MATNILFVIPKTDSEEALQMLSKIFLSFVKQPSFSSHHLHYTLVCSEENFSKLSEIFAHLKESDELTNSYTQETCISISSLSTFTTFPKYLDDLTEQLNENYQRQTNHLNKYYLNQSHHYADPHVGHIILAESTPSDIDNTTTHNENIKDCLRKVNARLSEREYLHPIPMIRITDHISTNFLPLCEFNNIALKKTFYLTADPSQLTMLPEETFEQTNKQSLSTHVSETILEHRRETAPRLWIEALTALQSLNTTKAKQLFQDHPQINLFHQYPHSTIIWPPTESLYHYIKMHKTLKDKFDEILPLHDPHFLVNQCLKACSSNITEVSIFLGERKQILPILKEVLQTMENDSVSKALLSNILERVVNTADHQIPNKQTSNQQASNKKTSNHLRQFFNFSSSPPTSCKKIKCTESIDTRTIPSSKDSALQTSFFSQSVVISTQALDKGSKPSPKPSIVQNAGIDCAEQSIRNKLQAILLSYETPKPHQSSLHQAMHKQLINLLDKKISKDVLIGALLESQQSITKEYRILSATRSQLFRLITTALKELQIEKINPADQAIYLAHYKAFSENLKNQTLENLFQKQNNTETPSQPSLH